MITNQDNEVWITLGIIGGVISAIAGAAAYYNDHQTYHIQDRSSPEQVYQRFFKAMKAGRYNRAYACILPTARKPGIVHTLKYKNEKIKPAKGEFAIRDAASFKKYWTAILSSTDAGLIRQMTLKKVHPIDDNAEMAVIEAECTVTSQSSTYGFGGLIFLLIAALTKQTEKIMIRKFMFRRANRWYVCEAEAIGMLDKLEIPEQK